jgi:hypothetical protein
VLLSVVSIFHGSLFFKSDFILFHCNSWQLHSLAIIVLYWNFFIPNTVAYINFLSARYKNIFYHWRQCTFDIITDFNVAIGFFLSGHPNWGLCTLLVPVKNFVKFLLEFVTIDNIYVSWFSY